MTKFLIKLCLSICVLLGSQAVLAGPVRCSVNNQDSTCLTPITTVWETAPTCPPSAGWTTITPAKWIGSDYSAPACNYQAPPPCAPGTTQQAAPTWNGSSWVGQICVPVSPPFNPVAACTAAVPGLVVSPQVQQVYADSGFDLYGTSGFTATSGWTSPAYQGTAVWAVITAGIQFIIPGDTSYSIGLSGPTYRAGSCVPGNAWEAFCNVNPGGWIDSILVSSPKPATTGSCTH